MEIPARPISIFDVLGAALLNGFNFGERGIQIDMRQAAIDHDLFAVHEHVANRPLGAAVNKAAQRLSHWHHRPLLQIDKHYIGPASGCEPANVVAQQRPRAAYSGGLEYFARRYVINALADNACGIGRHP